MPLSHTLIIHFKKFFIKIEKTVKKMFNSFFNFTQKIFKNNLLIYVLTARPIKEKHIFMKIKSMIFYDCYSGQLCAMHS